MHSVAPEPRSGLAVHSRCSVLCRGILRVLVPAGGFTVDDSGADSNAAHRPAAATAANAPPDRLPDAVFEVLVGGSQAALYRLSGDANPVRILSS